MPRSYDEIVRLSESMAESLEADETEPAITPEEAALRAAALRRALAEGEVGQAVAAARAANVPWERIGDAVGTSGEAARQRYRAVHDRFVAKSPSGRWKAKKNSSGRSAKVATSRGRTLEQPGKGGARSPGQTAQGRSSGNQPA